MADTPLVLLSPRDAARRLGISTSRLVQLDAEIAVVKDSMQRRFYRPEDVEAFAAKRQAARDNGAKINVPPHQGVRRLPSRRVAPA